MTLRFRSKGSLVNGSRVTYTHLNDTCNQTSWTVTGGQDQLTCGLFETMTDTVVDSFQARSARGEIIFNPMSRTRMEATDGSGTGFHFKYLVPITCTVDPKQRYGEQKNSKTMVGAYYAVKYLNGLFNVFPMPVSILSDKDISNAISECSTSVNAKRGQPDFNSLLTLAEGSQVISLLPNLFNSIRKVIVKTRNRYPGVDAANLFLLYWFGIKPLVSDVMDLVQGLDKPIGHIRVTTRDQIRMFKDRVDNLTYSAPQSNFELISQFQDEVKIRCMSLDEYNISLWNNLGVSLKGASQIPLEFVKYSFVLEWFVNLNDFLTSLVPTPGVKQLGSCVVVDRRKSLVCSIGSCPPNANWEVKAADTGILTSTIQTVSRTLGLPSPALVMRSDFKLGKLTRAAVALSLLLQSFGKPPRYVRDPTRRWNYLSKPRRFS